MQKARRHPTKVAPTACKRTVSGSISPSYSEYFSPFPHGTCSLSVSQEYLALPDGAGRFTQEFHRLPPTQDTTRYMKRFPIRDYHPLWSEPFQVSSRSIYMSIFVVLQPQHCRNNIGLGYSRSLATTWGIIIIFSSSGYLDVSVPGFASLRITILQIAGLPHSEICGS